MGSTRLRGKVLRELGGKTVLAHVVERVRVAKRVDDVWIATTVGPIDDAIQVEAAKVGAGCFRGSEEDVLDRYYRTALAAGADVVVRVTGDCPMFDGGLLDEMLADFHTGLSGVPPVDFMSNFINRRFPRGLDAEIFTIDVLRRVHRAAVKANEREHVTPYVYSHPEEFTIRSYVAPEDWSHHRWTLDTDQDWQFMEEVFSELVRTGDVFTTGQVLELLSRRPSLVALNAMVEQRYSAEQKP
jgi:spore coat polysaccharide biosynthesis protein SpsF